MNFNYINMLESIHDINQVVLALQERKKGHKFQVTPIITSHFYKMTKPSVTEPFKKCYFGIVTFGMETTLLDTGNVLRVSLLREDLDKDSLNCPEIYMNQESQFIGCFEYLTLRDGDG